MKTIEVLIICILITVLIIQTYRNCYKKEGMTKIVTFPDGNGIILNDDGSVSVIDSEGNIGAFSKDIQPGLNYDDVLSYLNKTGGYNSTANYNTEVATYAKNIPVSPVTTKIVYNSLPSQFQFTFS